MPCRNAGPFLQEAVASVLQQSECLELLVADGGSTDGSLEKLERWSENDSRLQIVSRSDNGPADALNQAFRVARGTLIGLLNADDLYPPGALARGVAALAAHPQWLMLYGEGEEFNTATGFQQRFPTLPPSAGLEGFRSHCFICQPSVLFRRSMGLLLGPFDESWRTAFYIDYWLRAFRAFPHRIGYVPHLQGRIRLHENNITYMQRSQVVLEEIELSAKHFGSVSADSLHTLGLELQLGIAKTTPGQTNSELLRQLACQATPWLDRRSLENFRHNWKLNNELHKTAESLSAPIHINAASKQPLALQLLHALHPQLHPNAPGSPVERETRCDQFIAIHKQRYHLLNTDKASQSAIPISAVSQLHRSNRPFGVNLIGHAFEMFGIGEDIRMAARALQAADVPCCVIHHPAGNGAACMDRTLEPLICSDPQGGPYAFNLVCMAAPIHARWLLKSGFDPLSGRYTIAAWPWETRMWPELWDPLLEVVDEVWPSSAFVAHSLKAPAAQANIPLNVMSMAAEIPDPERFCFPSIQQKTRAHLGLPEDAVVFVYSFDLNSTTIRKNPMAALETFQQAFPLPHLLSSQSHSQNIHHLSERVVLLIKTFPPSTSNPEWNWLQLRAQEDPRIHVLEANLERDALIAMFGCCDVFLSLHRSEGFGRGMAEALQLGLDVIATAYGGNTDFCNGPLAHLVRCREVPIPRSAYPYADGHCWGEPDLDHAAQLMHQVAERRLKIRDNPDTAFLDISRNKETLSNYRKYFSLSTVGEAYKVRLRQLWHELF
ncbi:glycosyltransferase [bacterium]|nr:glycosyltransferase [bacterium]